MPRKSKTTKKTAPKKVTKTSQKVTKTPAAKAPAEKKVIDKATPIKKPEAEKKPLSRRERIEADRDKCYKHAQALVEAIANSVQPEGSLVEVRQNLEGWMRQHETTR